MVDLDYIHGISFLLRKGLESPQIYEGVFKLLEKTIDFDSATLYTYYEETHQIKIAYQYGNIEVDLAKEIQMGLGNGISGWIAQYREPVVVSSLSKSRPGKEGRFNSFLSLPLVAENKLIGVVNFGSFKEHVYSSEKIEDYRLIADEISIVIDRLRLQSDLKLQNQQMSETLKQLQLVQAELVEKERLAAIGELIITVNHEINNPLTSIIGLAEIIDMTLPTASIERIRQALKSIIQQARRIQRVTHQLSNLRNIETVEYIAGKRMINLKNNNTET